MTAYLAFRDTLFVEVNHSEVTNSDLAVLVIDGSESTLHFSESITLIDKLTAQRQANSIVKTGFLLTNNSRVGANSNLKVVVGSIPISESVSEPTTELKSQRAVEPNVNSEPDFKDESTPKQESEVLTEAIRFTVPKEPVEPSKKEEILGFSKEDESDNLIEGNDSISDGDKGPSIQDVFREEQQKVMSEEPPTPAPKTYDEVVEYFWKELFGQVYDSWSNLPTKAREDFFSSLNIGKLTDDEVQLLFTIRHENNIEGFKAKLNEFRERNKE